MQIEYREKLLGGSSKLDENFLKPLTINLTKPHSLDEQLRQEGFQEIGEFSPVDLAGIWSEEVILRFVDKAELDPNYTPGRTFVIYQKRKRFNFSDFSIKKPKY